MHAQTQTITSGARRAKSFTRGPRVLWTPAEVERLAAILKADPDVVFTTLTDRFPGRTGVGIRLQAQLLGLSEAGTRKAHATPEEVAEVLRMLRGGTAIGKIVKATGRTHRYVHKLAGEHGLTVVIGTPEPKPKAPKAPRAPRPAKAAAPRAVAAAKPKAVLPAVGKAVATRAPAPVQEPVARAPVATAVAAPAAPVSAEMAFLLAPKQPTAKSKSRTTTFGRGFGRHGVKVERTPELAAMIADFVAKRGVTRVEADPVTAAAEALRRRGYVVLRDGEGFLVDHKARVASGGDLIAYARHRGLAA